MNKLKQLFILWLSLAGSAAWAQGSLFGNSGHSHNDYNQDIPFIKAYNAGMGSIEADVYLVDGLLYVAHELNEVVPGKTLDKFYLQPLAERFRKNGNQPYADTAQKLQLVIDIKTDHAQVIPALIKELEPYRDIIDPARNKRAIHVVLSGDMPSPVNFKDYPRYIFYDGRPYINYTPEQLKQVAMISDALGNYIKWNGKDPFTSENRAKLEAVVQKAHLQHKPFRFWGTPDNAATWLELEKIGVDWMNTDHPEELQRFYAKRIKTN